MSAVSIYSSIINVTKMHLPYLNVDGILIYIPVLDCESLLFTVVEHMVGTTSSYHGNTAHAAAGKMSSEGHELRTETSTSYLAVSRFTFISSKTCNCNPNNPWRDKYLFMDELEGSSLNLSL